MDLKRYNNEHKQETVGGLFPFEHKDILEVKQLLTFIENITTEKSLTILPQYISTATPIAGKNNTRLIYALHSQLPLNIYDNFGHHAGVSTTTHRVEEDIPGVYFREFADIQYIFTMDSNTKNTIVIGGGGGGTSVPESGSSNTPFTLQIEKYYGGIAGDTESLMATTTFFEIPATASTTAQITIENNDLSSSTPLVVDTESDGTPDIILIPKIDDVVTFEISTTTTTLNSDSGEGTLTLLSLAIPSGNGPIVASVPLAQIKSIISNFVSSTSSSPVSQLSQNPVIQNEDVKSVHVNVDTTSEDLTSDSFVIPTSTKISLAPQNNLLAQVSASGSSSYLFNMSNVQKLLVMSIIILAFFVILYLIR